MNPDIPDSWDECGGCEKPTPLKQMKLVDLEEGKIIQESRLKYIGNDRYQLRCSDCRRKIKEEMDE